MLKALLHTVLAEPPLRLLTKAAVKALPVSVHTKALWDAVNRPQYLVGVLYAADQAKREGRDAISVIEFGVAEGDGLLALQAHAIAVERETAIRVNVYGFDRKDGLPTGVGDYRDHPDVWQGGDYAMDVATLKGRLAERTRLILGDIQDTVRHADISAPIGFMAVDIDLYSSAVSTLEILRRADVPRLRRVALYFDDLAEHYNHCFAGELLAIEEFNVKSLDVKVDRWRGLRAGRPFPDAPWVDSMFLAHDLTQIGKVRLTRPPARMR